MYCYRHICITGLVFILGVTTHAQIEPRFEHRDTRHGLSYNTVNAIYQDKQGFMWFGTSFGLNKYDGYEFTVFNHDPNDSNTLRNGGINSILEDRKGRLWIGTWGGLHELDKRTGVVRYYPQKDPKRGINTVVSMYEDKNGSLWIAGSWGISQFDPETKTFTLFPEKTNINGVTGDPDGKLWLSSARGLYQFDPSNRKFTSVDLPAQPTAVHADPDGKLWIGTLDKGVFQMDIKDDVYAPIPYKAEDLEKTTVARNGIFTDKQKNIWVATDKGLQRIFRNSGQLINYRFNPVRRGTLNSDDVKSIFEDTSGNFWIGTVNGINKLTIHSKPFFIYQTNTSFTIRLLENNITALEIDRNGIVWTGTSEGLTKLDSNLKQIVRYPFIPNDPHHHSGEWVQALYEDRAGRFWIGTDEDLLLLDQRTGRFTSYPFESSHVYSAISEDPSGKLWFGADSTLMAFDPGTKKYTYYRKDPSGLKATYITKVKADRSGNIWIGTINRGMIHLDPRTGKFTDYPPQTIFPGNATDVLGVHAIYEDRKGMIWIGTGQNGLHRYDPKAKTFSHFTSREGLVSNSITSIIEDAGGDIWIGSFGGLSRLDTGSKTIRNYDDEDGLPDNEFTRVWAREKNGKLFFANRNGLVVFYPDSIKDDKKPPPVYITGFKVLEQNRTVEETIRLPYHENFLSFDMVALNYNSPEKNQYAYMLEGLDKDWIQAGTRHHVSYTNLEPGTYTFRVKGSNNDGVWNEEGDSMNIIILPPWWKTWWAYTLYVLVLATGIFFFYRAQKQRLIEKEREKGRERELAQAREIEKAYHDLKATQAQLIQSEKMASLGELTAGIAHEIQNPLNFVNNFSEVNEELIEELKVDIQSGRLEVALSTAANIKENSQKITHHGKRADAIVKGMLQHSRSSTTKKEPTDINELIDEYLRLSYHGFRAKEKSFNALIQMNFDKNLPKVSVIPQDIGRVVLNLFTNSFYSINEKRKSQDNTRSDKVKTYEPAVTVITAKINGSIEIRVRDNGLGVPQKVLDKIFQPFFTTKPVGKGTGLGLSLSYDIIKAHGGELKVETKEGEFAEFIITLPINSD